MNPFNRYEAIGIFVCVAIMAIALSVIRFKTDVFTLADSVDSDTQTALVSVADENTMDEEELEDALIDASSVDGTLRELVIDDVRIGSGEAVKDGDTVTVQYVGTTQDGVKFDSSYDRGIPYEFTVGDGKVIEGWDKGILGMKVGGQRILVIPAEMGYGNTQVGPISPNSPLVFSVELIAIK